MKEELRKQSTENELIPEEELVPEDDAIIGRVFRWSLLVITCAVGIVVLTILFNRSSLSDEEVRNIDVQPPERLVPDLAAAPAVSFTDITRAAGIEFVHTNGARGEKLLPETFGGGCAFLDYDNDGDQDILLVNSSDWPWSASVEPDKPTMALYENDGNGHFGEVTTSVGLDVTFYGMGVAVGDYDGDGLVDLFFTAIGPNHLFRNLGNRFVEVTSAAGVAGNPEEWSTSSGFFDYDNDGDLDLFVCNYVRWNREIDFELGFTLNGVDRAYGPPNNFSGTSPYLYRNRGDGSFVEVSGEAGLQIRNPATGLKLAKSLGVVFLDIDQDEWIDIVVANDTVQNFFFHNLGDGKFEELGIESGVAFDSNGQSTGAMGIDAGYFRNDDQLGIGMGNFANEMSSFYVTQENALWFADEAMGEGIGSPSRLNLTFGLFFFDYDLDGRLDLLQANGHLEEEINQVQASQYYHQPAQLFWNTGRRDEPIFVQIPQAGDLTNPIVGRGAAYADIDGDGDVDILLTQAGGAPKLLRNDQNLGHNWIRVRVIGRGSNRNALGARVCVTAEGETRCRNVMPTRSYISQVELPVTFGLGTAQKVDSLRVEWPDGTSQIQEDVPLNRQIDVEQRSKGT
jgi:hypothetical protein